MATQYGQTVITISDLVRKFSLKQGNTKAINFIRNMEFASWAWKELFRTTIWEIKTVVIPVDHITNNITIPGDCERLVNISVVDRFGKIQPLSYNPNLSTVEIACQKTKCSCKRCGGNGTLCGAVENITTVQEEIVINGDPYTKITYIRADRCGDILKEEDVPVWDPTTSSVTRTTITTLICKVEVTEHGCIKPTAPNMNTLQQYLGLGNGGMVNNLGNTWWGNGINPYRSLIPAPYNYYGQWNWNAACRDIIHIFRSAKRNCTFVNSQQEVNNECHGEENDICQVILSYQTIGVTSGEEILIPEYAEMAINTGMIYQQALFNPRDGDRNNAMLYKFRAEKKKVAAHLNPIRMDDIIKLQTQPHLW